MILRQIVVSVGALFVALRLHNRRKRPMSGLLRRRSQSATRYSLALFRPSTRVSPQARHECKLAWTSTVRTKQPGQTAV
jgi:hypothetical protein